MKASTKKSIIRKALLSTVLFALILAKFSNTGTAAITRASAAVVSYFFHLTKSLNLSQYHIDIGNMCLVTFLVVLIFLRSLLIRKIQP